MDPFRNDNDYYPPHQSYGYPAAPPAPLPAVDNYYSYTMPPNYSNAMHSGYCNAMYPSYPNAMPPTPPGYPYNPPSQTYPIHQPSQNYWQPPEGYPGTPPGFDAYGHQATWPEQAVEPDQGWPNEIDNSSHEHRDFDVVEVKRNVLPPPPKVPHARPFHKQRKATMIIDLEAMEDVSPPEISKSEDASKPSELDHDSAASPAEPFHKQRKAIMIIDLEAMEDVSPPEISKSENASKISEMHRDNIVAHVEPFHKQQKTPMTIDLETMEVINPPKISKSKNASKPTKSKISELDRHEPAEAVDAYAGTELLSPDPVQIRRSSTRDKATTQSEIPKSWVLRSNDKKSALAKRPISASFGTVETSKKLKPTASKSKGSDNGRSGSFWGPEELKIAREAKRRGESYDSIADLLDRTPSGVEKRLLKVAKIWVPRIEDLKLMWSLVIEQKVESFEDAWNRFRSRASYEGSRWLFNKIKNGCRFTSIPTVPENFFVRIDGVNKGERFEHKDGRHVVYPGNSSEAFEYRWIDGQLVIVDTANLLINVNPLLVWYPFINKLRFIKPTCYAVVEQKTTKWFRGEWVSLISGVRLYVLSGHWTDEFQDLVLFDKDGNRRQTHRDMVRGFKDDNGEIMCSLCDLAFASQDSYQLHAGLHDQGWPHIRHCCLCTLTKVKPSQESHFCLQHQTAEVGLIKTIVDRHAHGTFRKVMDFKGSLNHATNIAHDWDLIAYSVRWSGANLSAKSGQFNSDLEQLVEAYENSYKPTFKKVIKSPLSPRSSRCPIFVQSNVVRPSVTNDFFGQIHGMEQSSRILILSQSIEGLTTNLQSLVFFARSMKHLRITLGFCILRPDRLLDFGQEVEGGKGWVFYDLQTLRNNITGVATDPRYMRLVKALFFIQKRKQDPHLTIDVSPTAFGGGQGRNHDIFASSGAMAMLGAHGEKSDDATDEDDDFDGDDGNERDEEFDEVEDK